MIDTFLECLGESGIDFVVELLWSLAYENKQHSVLQIDSGWQSKPGVQMDFLFEIGLEEVPARMLQSAQDELVRRTRALLARERLCSPDAEAVGYSTPRRLAVVVREVAERQEDLSEEVMGPAAKIAFKDGSPGPAAIAFAKKSGVDVAALRIVSTPKGDYVVATSTKPGRRAAEVIAAEMSKEIAGIYWAKNMSWRAGKPERFVRPVRWLLALLGKQVVPVEFGGYTAGRITFGHRVLHGAASIEVAGPDRYVDALHQAFVRCEVEQRRHTIRKALDRVCRTAGGTRWREDHALVDKMTHLTEWPSVILGSFEREYLSLPEEVLVTVMRDHQNYFAVEDAESKKLAPHFLAVLNTATNEAGEAVIRHGNERVLRARFNDARFFWEFDQRMQLEERVKLLEQVTFQKDLGSYQAKSERTRLLAAELGKICEQRGYKFDSSALDEAARLAKVDLTSELVKEFTELQGQIGGLYARAQGFSDAIADAIYDQYLPASMDDAIPRTPEGRLLSIADRMDTIAGMFGLGFAPTGSKDPFALRRAANGIVKILAESDVPLLLSEIAKAASADASVGPFLGERLDFYLREAAGHAYDVVKSVLAVGADDVGDALQRAQAVTAVRDSEDFRAVCSAFKRMRNLLSQAAEKGLSGDSAIEPLLLSDASERELAKISAQVAERVKRLRAERNYAGALEAIATLRPQVDSFFESVMVLTPDAAVRANRLALLARVLADFGGIADYSEMVVAG